MKRFRSEAVTMLVALALVPLLAWPAFSQAASDQEEGGRKVVTKVEPSYPQLAQKYKIGGVVKLQVTIAPNGDVKTVKVIGGHPVLLDAATTAVKEWKYERASKASVDTIEITFTPGT